MSEYKVKVWAMTENQSNNNLHKMRTYFSLNNPKKKNMEHHIFTTINIRSQTSTQNNHHGVDGVYQPEQDTDILPSYIKNWLVTCGCVCVCVCVWRGRRLGRRVS